jgi:hypothetical protein
MPGVNREIFNRLCRERRIWTMGGDRLRVSAHIHTRPRDIELFFATLAESRA